VSFIHFNVLKAQLNQPVQPIELTTDQFMFVGLFDPGYIVVWLNRLN